MTEDLLTKNPMDEDLLTKIQRETHERLCELRGAVDEHDRLTGELSALDAVPEPAVDPELVAALEAVPEPRVVPEQHAALDVESEPPATLEAVLEPSSDTAPPANVVRLPARPRFSCTCSGPERLPEPRSSSLAIASAIWSAPGMSGCRRCTKRRSACAEIAMRRRSSSVIRRAKFGSGLGCPRLLMVWRGSGRGVGWRWFSMARSCGSG